MVWYCIIVALGVMGWLALTYYQLWTRARAVQHGKTQLDEALDARFCIFEAWIQTMLLHYEHTPLADIVQWRSQAQGCRSQGDIKGQFQAEEKINRLTLAMGENFHSQYKGVCDTTQWRAFNHELAQAQTRLQARRIHYNDCVASYNTIKHSTRGYVLTSVAKAHVCFVYDYWLLPQVLKTSQGLGAAET